MSDITLIREAMAAALDTIPNVQVSAYALGNVTPPCIEVQPGPVKYDAAMGRGSDDLRFIVRAYAANNLDRSAQKHLDILIAGSGVNSVKAALERDRTLGGTCTGLRVTANAGYLRMEHKQGEFLVSEWTVEVIALGT